MAKNKSYTIHPGWHLAELMDSYEISNADLASIIDVTIEKIEYLITRRLDVDTEMAAKLSKIFHISEQGWIKMQNDYNAQYLAG